MCDALQALTRAQILVLAYLSELPPSVPVSSRQVAEILALSRRTVQAALHRLNELDFIRSDSHSRIEASRHSVLTPFVSLPRTGVLVGGAILGDAVENHSSSGEIAPPVPGAIPGDFHTVPGAIPRLSTGGLNNERARVTNTYTYPETEALVGVSGAERWKTSPTEPGSRPEILVMVERWFWPIDDGLAEKFLALPARFGISGLELTRFWEAKWRHWSKQRRDVWNPGAFFQFSEIDLPGWVYMPGRKPAVVAPAPRPEIEYGAPEPQFSQNLVRRAAAGVGRL